MDLPPTGEYFGDRAIELAGIIIHPSAQGRGIGAEMVNNYISEEKPSRLVAYTRNPSLLRAVGHACRLADVLSYDSNASELAASIPNATLESDGHLYHVGRYAPHGLYGTFDPARQNYMGRPLMERAVLLDDPTNALAISVSTGEN